MIWLIIIAAAVLLVVIIKITKIPKFGNMTLITGGVKTGKTTMSVWLSVRQYWRQLRKYYIANYIIYPIFHVLPFKWAKKLKKREKPLYYSNVPVKVKKYVPLTTELIERRVRFRYGSVIYICESSLVADSQTIKDQLINEEMLLLNKLIAHETKGGYIFYDTQSISDNHYAVKRCLASYINIHHMRKIPFFCLAWVREMQYSEDGNIINNFESDVEDTLQLVIIPKKVWKLFDCYCYSALTDHLPVADQTVKVEDLKARKIISFRNYKTIPAEYIEKREEQPANEKEN